MPGSTVTFTLVAQISPSATGNLTNTATVGTTATTPAGVTDSNPANNTATDTDTTTGTPNVVVTKTADQPSILAGQTAGFTVTIKNTGTATATGVTLNDPLPPGAGSDINWVIDTTVDNPTDFQITGAVGSQVLSFNPSTMTLAVGASISVHYKGLTTVNDTSSSPSTNPALNVGGLASYAVLYEGTGNNQLSISNDIVQGNIGVGGGQVQFSGPGTIAGRLDFAAANTGQYHNTNGSNVGPTSVNYNVSAVTTAITAANSLSTALGGLSGTSISFNNANQTVNESSGTLHTSGGVSYRVFNVTSYSENNADTVTINGDGSGDPVVFNFAYSSNTNLGGQVTLTGGLTNDQVMWNFTSSGKQVQLNNNGGTFAGVLLLPNDQYQSNSSNLDGRVYGGAGGNMQIVSGANVYVPLMGSLPNTATVNATGEAPQMASATITITTGTVTTTSIPSISTTPSQSVVSQGTATCVTDTATLSGGVNPTGTITFTLYGPTGSKLDTETVSVNGDGTYTTPKGYTLSSTATPGVYQWNATYNGNSNNSAVSDNNDPAEQVTVITCCTLQNLTYSLTLGGKTTTVTDLTGNTKQGETVSVNFTVPSGYYVELSLVSYVTPQSYFSGSSAYLQQPSQSVTQVFGPGKHTLGPVTIPSSYYQIDFVCGTVISQLGLSPSDFYSAQGSLMDSDNGGTTVPTSLAGSSVGANETAATSFWIAADGQGLINSLNGGPNATNLGNWLATVSPNLFGSLQGKTNSSVASYMKSLGGAAAQVLATALSAYVTDSSLAGTVATSNHFTVTAYGTGVDSYNVGSYGSALGLTNKTSYSIVTLLASVDSLSSKGVVNSSASSAASAVFSAINTAGGIKNAALSNSGLAYTPAQIRAAYGINSLTQDGTGQTIAIVDAYDDPNILASVDAFDGQFGLTNSGPSLYDQYGPAESFLTFVNQNGQTTSLPATDPSGAGSDNWEVEEALDVEWAHAIAPGARIILVEANSQSLSDLMAGVATAASQPGVSVVSMSWGFPEGQAVFAADEALYDSVFNVPGVTFVASTGDYGTADPEYPSFSPNVVSVGGTSLNLNTDNSYNNETGWGSTSNASGMAIGSGGGLSLYEPEPAYQQGIQSTGSRTTPDVSFDADPTTGAWIADSYNLDPSNPFEVVGGTSLSSPAFAGLIAVVDQGRVATGEATLNSAGPTEAAQALYSLPQSAYNTVTSGNNGYAANAGYNLVTGLGTPVANVMVPDLVAYQGPSTSYAGPTVGPLQDATLTSNWMGGGGIANVFSALTVSSSSLGQGQGAVAASPLGTSLGGTPVQALVANHTATTPLTTPGATLSLATGGSFSQHGPIQVFGLVTNASPQGSLATTSPTVTASTSPLSMMPAVPQGLNTLAGSYTIALYQPVVAGLEIVENTGITDRLDGFAPAPPFRISADPFTTGAVPMVMPFVPLSSASASGMIAPVNAAPVEEGGGSEEETDEATESEVMKTAAVVMGGVLALGWRLRSHLERSANGRRGPQRWSAERNLGLKQAGNRN